jgi:hypothetical protein
MKVMLHLKTMFTRFIRASTGVRTCGVGYGQANSAVSKFGIF